MGKILQFKSNELINKFNLCKAAIEDYFDKFFNYDLKKLSITMLNELIKANPDIIVNYKTYELVSSIINIIQSNIIKKSSEKLSIKELSTYFEVDEITIEKVSKNIIDILGVKKLDNKILSNDFYDNNDIFLSSIGKKLKAISFIDSDIYEKYLEDDLSIWIEDFFESSYFLKLSEIEQEFADLIIETFDFCMSNYIYENNDEWSVPGVKQCCLELLPNKLSWGMDVCKSIPNVLENFLMFLGQNLYITNGCQLSLVVKILSVDIIKNAESILNKKTYD